MKSCYVYGGLGHVVKQCTKKNCYIYKKGGHRAKDSPEKHPMTRVPKSLKVCLKCGYFGHDIFSCMNDYSPDVSRWFFSFLSYISNLLEDFDLVCIRIVPYIGYEWLSQ